ncbi:MAG: ATP-binding cassette domain-containing protein [Candidatus Aenigmarchaeota archaeon]|nr:ATP-binding cassette domain-containing protein [Candidatus Aenigmarchaeota archaeon]
MKDVVLEVKNLCYKTEDKEILKGINFVVRKGEISSIIGVNGTGKTTLAYVLMGLNGYRPTSGKIVFNGKNIINFSPTRRAKLGMTLAWQIPASFEGITIGEYLNINNNSNPRDLLKTVGLNPDTYMNRYVDDKLSGGERKRIELASVLSINPKLIILDEPDSGIDMTSINVIKRIIKNLKKNGTSVVLITHSEAMAKLGDRLLLLCNGKFVKEGPPDIVTKFFKKHCKKCGHIGKIEEEILNE